MKKLISHHKQQHQKRVAQHKNAHQFRVLKTLKSLKDNSLGIIGASGWLIGGKLDFQWKGGL